MSIKVVGLPSSVYRLSSAVRRPRNSASRTSARITEAISIPEGQRTLASNSSQVARVWFSRARGSSRAAARMISPNVRSIPGAIQSVHESQFMHNRTSWAVEVMMMARNGARVRGLFVGRPHNVDGGRGTMDDGRLGTGDGRLLQFPVFRLRSSVLSCRPPSVVCRQNSPFSARTGRASIMVRSSAACSGQPWATAMS